MNQEAYFNQISVKDGQGLVFDIRTVSAAAAFLVMHWPDAHRGSWKHIKAQTSCLDVLEGKQEAENARLAFEEAAREAGILVDENS